MNSSLDNCVHFWDVDELRVDGVWHGTCRKCGAERDFNPEYEDERKMYWTSRQKKRAEELTPSNVRAS